MIDLDRLRGPTPLRPLEGTKAHFAEGIATVAEAIERIVVDSYEKHPLAGGRTAAEDKRRAAICVRWYKQLQHEHRFTPDRALSELSTILRCELAGLTYVPPLKQTMFAVDRRVLGA